MFSIPGKQAVSLTPTAARQIAKLMEKDGSKGLRIGVKKTGCNGFAYVVNYADEINDADRVFEDRGVTVVVDETSLALIDGTEVDFVKEGLNEAFQFRNPNISGECGCGESFSI